MLQTCNKLASHFLLKPCTQNSGAALILVIILTFIGTLVIGAVSLSSRYTIKRSSGRRINVEALSIAEAGKEKALGQLRFRQITPPPDTMIVLYSNQPFGNGSYTVTCSTNTAFDTILLHSTGNIETETVTLEVIAKINMGKWFKGAVTARTDVVTKGGIQIDGRDHDTTTLFGTPLGTGGIVGVAAGGTVSAGGSSTIGGRFTAPQQATVPGETVAENIDLTDYPQTPEEVFGLPPGALDSYKCTTCPPSTYFGIVYTETPCDFAGGIYILHNSSGTASLGNYHGHFKGILIADEVFHFNAASSVLGAVFMLGKTTGGNSFGDGAARIHYSSRMLTKAFKELLAPGRIDVEVVSWREIK